MKRSNYADTKLVSFGCEAYYHKEANQRRKLYRMGSRGIIIGYVNIGYHFLDFDDLRSNKGTIYPRHTRCVIINDNAFPACGVKYGTQLFDAPSVWIPDENEKCKACGKLITYELATCRACRNARNNRKPHKYDKACGKMRCKCKQHRMPAIEEQPENSPDVGLALLDIPDIVDGGPYFGYSKSEISRKQ